MELNKYAYQSLLFLMLTILSFLVLMTAVDKEIVYLIIISVIAMLVFGIFTMLTSLNAMGYFRQSVRR